MTGPHDCYLLIPALWLDPRDTSIEQLVDLCADGTAPFEDTLSGLQAMIIRRALARHTTISKAARILRMRRTTLLYRMHALGIRVTASMS
jgi:transcriptional regulator with PAS, ATPase and Fis domain